MEKLLIKGESGSFIEIIYSEVYGFPENTSYFGGYEVSAKINIKSEGFSLNSDFYTSTGEIYTFFENLKLRYIIIFHHPTSLHIVSCSCAGS